MDNTFQVLKILYRAQGTVSGEEIGARLGITRNAVSKHIRKLRNCGFSIDSGTNAGHALRSDPGLYNQYALELALSQAGAEMPVTFLEQADSTNFVAKSPERAEPVGLVAARRQTGGRGRKDRSFSSGEGGLYFSYYCKPYRLLPYDAARAVLAAGLAVAESLRLFGAEAGIKWPNDVLVGGRKICGILCEMIAGADDVQRLILGIGINVANVLPPELSDTAVSLQELGVQVPLCRLCAEVVARLQVRLNQLQDGSFAAIADDYGRYSLTFGRTVKVIEESRTYTARALGLDENGFLRVQTSEGESLVVTGDVSIRGVDTGKTV